MFTANGLVESAYTELCFVNVQLNYLGGTQARQIGGGVPVNCIRASAVEVAVAASTMLGFLTPPFA